MEVELEQDVRIIRRNLAKGFISPGAVNELLSDLPDVEEQGEWFDPTAEPAPVEAPEAPAETAAE